MPTTLKLYFTLPGTSKQEVRRVTMEDPLTLDAIRSFLASKYPPADLAAGESAASWQVPPFRIEYEDEDADRIVVSGQLELEEGLRHHAAAAGGAAPWKLFCAFDDEVSLSPSSSPRAVNQAVEEPLIAAGVGGDSASSATETAQQPASSVKSDSPAAVVTVEDALSDHASDDEYERVEADAQTDAQTDEEPTTCATPTHAAEETVDEPDSPMTPATPSLASLTHADAQELTPVTETAPLVEPPMDEPKAESPTNVAELADATAALRLAPGAESAALAEARLESLIDQRAVDRFACRLCTKVFLARHFVVQHLNTKHREVIAQEVESEETPTETAMPEAEPEPKSHSEVKQPQSSPTSQTMTVAPEKAVVPVTSPSPLPLVEESSPKSSSASVEIADVTGHPEHVEPSPEPVTVPMAESPASSSNSTSATHEGVTCDSCGMSPIVGIRWRCVQCPVPGGFDLCAACESAGDRHDPSHVLMKLRQPAFVPVGTTHALPRHHHCSVRAGRMQAAPASSSTSTVVRRPKALFVSDVTLADGLAVSAGETLTKIWSIKNVGETAWPAGTRIVFVGGDLAPESENRTDPYGAVVPFAGPGDVVHISLAIQVPNATGRFRGTFRLETPDRQRFGPRIWIDLVVPEDQQQAQAQEKPTAAAAGEDQLKPAAAAPVVESKPVAEVQSPGVDEEAEFAAACAASLATPQPTTPVASPLPSQPSFVYSNQLAQLRSMGFTADAELYRYLLLNTKGDVQAVVAWLLNNAK